MRRLAPLIAILALVAIPAACDSSDGGASEPAAATAGGRTAQFLDGGRDAFEARIEKERGKPIVVNKWASWCGPCRAEFPFFGDQAKKRRGEIVFLGVNSSDNRGDAEEFLREYPVPFPHFEDPDLEVAASFNGVQAFPTTAFYDSAGELAYVHQGGYASEEKLAEDIGRYAR